MSCGFGYWRNVDGFDREYRRRKWVDEHLGRDIQEANPRREWQRRQLEYLGRDIESARQHGTVEEANDLAYYAGRLRHELGVLEGRIG